MLRYKNSKVFILHDISFFLNWNRLALCECVKHSHGTCFNVEFNLNIDFTRLQVEDIDLLWTRAGAHNLKFLLLVLTSHSHNTLWLCVSAHVSNLGPETRGFCIICIICVHYNTLKNTLRFSFGCCCHHSSTPTLPPILKPKCTYWIRLLESMSGNEFCCHGNCQVGPIFWVADVGTIQYKYRLAWQLPVNMTAKPQLSSFNPFQMTDLKWQH